VPRRHLTGRFLAITALAAFFVTLSGQAFAQGYDWSQLLGGGRGSGGSSGGGGGGLSQLFGGGAGGGQMHQRSGQAGGAGVSVERNAPPFTGKFSGKQEDQGIENTMTAQFACYPASDSDIPQNRAFVCYSAPTNENGSTGGPPFRRAGGPPPYGPPPGGGPSYGSVGGGPPNGPPPDIE
jgi:hypothetical protein